MYEDCVLQSMRFPQKLWRIVNECESGAIRWGTNGDTVLLDYKRFQAEYLDARRPIFKTSNITSFIRQLNLYGFRKVTSHSRDPICNYHNPHVHEFLHDNFRSDRTDLLSKVCRKTGGKGKYSFQHGAPRGAEDSGPRLAASCVSRLKLCQLALTKTLEQITQEYRRKHEEKSVVTKNNTLKTMRNAQDAVLDLCEIEFNNVSTRDRVAAECNAKYSAFLLSKTVAPSERKTVSSWGTNTIDKYGRRFDVQDNH